MRGRFVTISIIALGALAVPATSDACSVIVDRQPNSVERLRMARQLIERATAIVDGEVVRPLIGDQPAFVRASRVWKGPNQPQFQVGYADSCDVALTSLGQRLRLILEGGPETYFLRVDYDNAIYEDRIIGSDRRRDWPFQEGAAASR